ncbi:hypothetical protein BC567DRAFT_48571 [Phyllosticta citribraziliensis]
MQKQTHLSIAVHAMPNHPTNSTPPLPACHPAIPVPPNEKLRMFSVLAVSTDNSHLLFATRVPCIPRQKDFCPPLVFTLTLFLYLELLLRILSSVSKNSIYPYSGKL